MISPFDLTGRVAIVTGAGRGIGKRLAQALAEHGASVVVADLEGERAESTADEIAAAGAHALAIPVNVVDPDDVDRLMAETVRRFGTIDILVNNVGGTMGRTAATEELSVEDWRSTFDLTVTSAFLCAQRAGRVMLAKKYGKIVNVASVYGLVGHDPSNSNPRADGRPYESIAYAAAKGAVVQFTRALAVYWADYHVTVNAIAPGLVQTELTTSMVSPAIWERISTRTPMGRPAHPEDMKGAVVFLASSASDFVTGQILPVDGGWTIW